MIDAKKLKKFNIFFLITIIFFIFISFDKNCFANDGYFQEDQRYKAKDKQEKKIKKSEEKDVFLKNEVDFLKTELFPEENIMFMINEIILDGDDSREFKWIQKKLNSYKNRKIGKKGIKNLVQLIEGKLIAKGYSTTKIVIPEQDLLTGVLHFKIIPGKIGNVNIYGEKNVKWQSAFPFKKGDILNNRNIEQGLEQMLRIQSQDVQIKLVPGLNLGETDICIYVKRGNPIQSMIVVDDGGTKEIGKVESKLIYNIDNLFNNNDTFSIALGHDLSFKEDKKGMKNYSLYYTFPYKEWTFSIDKYCFDYHQSLLGFSRDFQYSSRSNHIEITAQKLLNRGQYEKTSISFTLGKQVINKYLEDILLDIQSQETSFGKLKLMHRWYNDDIVYDVGVGCNFSLPWLGSKADVAEIVDKYKIWTFDGQVGMPICILGKKGRYSCQIWGQYTKDYIYPSDEFAIGGRYTVRGFDGEQSLSDENGFVLRNEWSFFYDSKKDKEYYIGIDWGRVNGRYTEDLAGHSLVGSAFGVRGTVDKLQYDVFIGVPIKKPKEFEVNSVCYGFEVKYLL